MTGFTKGALQTKYETVSQKSAVVPAYVYSFGSGETSAEELFKGDLDTRKTPLGGKGEGLHSMTRAGIPVPPGFKLTTAACKYYYAHDRKRQEGLERDIKIQDSRTGKTFK